MIKVKTSTDLVQLQLQHVYLSTPIPRSKIECANVDIRVHMTAMCDEFNCTISAAMAGGIVDRHQYPKTWWDAFKQRWFPAFMRRWFPITTVIVETWQCYPEWKLPDSYGRAIQVFQKNEQVVN